jgi:hypothetical protein
VYSSPHMNNFTADVNTNHSVVGHPHSSMAVFYSVCHLLSQLSFLYPNTHLYTDPDITASPSQHYLAPSISFYLRSYTALFMPQANLPLPTHHCTINGPFCLRSFQPITDEFIPTNRRAVKTPSGSNTGCPRRKGPNFGSVP